MAKIKILLIEDNRLLREGTTALLNERDDMTVVSSPGNSGAIAKAAKLVPDVVLLDLGLKSQSSMKVLASIKKQNPRTEVVVMDLIPAHLDAVEFVNAGVSGFIPKDASLDYLLHTIRSVVKGVNPPLPKAANSLLSQIVEQAIQGGKANRVIAAVKFTKPEQKVISLLAQGETFATTSVILKIAVHTVNNHIRNILDKLALHTRLELTAFAHKRVSS